MTHQFGLDDLAWIALGVALFAATPFALPAWRWFTARYFVGRADDYVEYEAGSVGSGTVRNHAEPAEPVPVRARLYQECAGSADENEPVREPPTEHNDTALIAYLATLKGEHGYRFSANKIADLMGGTRAEVLAAIAIHRPQHPARTKPRRLERPANGW